MKKVIMKGDTMKVDGYNIPDDLHYTKDHEWIRRDKDGCVKIGITDYAQQMLKEITFVYFPEKGITFNIFETICTVESIKAISELFSPITGEISQINEKLLKKPNLINEDPYGKGWILTIHPQNFDEEVEKLITSKQYAQIVEKLLQVDKNLLIYRWKETEL